MKSLKDYLNESIINEAKQVGKLPEFTSKEEVRQYFENIGLDRYGHCFLYSLVNGRHVYIKYEYEELNSSISDNIIFNISETNSAPSNLFKHANRNRADKEHWIAFAVDGGIHSDFGANSSVIKKNFDEFIGKPTKFWSGNEKTIIASINSMIKDLQDMGANWTKVRG